MKSPDYAVRFSAEMQHNSDLLSELFGLWEGFREDFLGDDVRKLLKDLERVSWALHHSWLNLNEIHYQERQERRNNANHS